MKQVYKKRKIFLFLIFLCFFSAWLAAQRAGDIVGDTFEETDGTGLVVRTNPAGVRVFIDGLERGLSPVTLNNLQSGEHSVRLYKEGYKERRFNVTLFNNSRLVVSIEMKEEAGQVLVSVRRARGSPDGLPLSPNLSSNAQSSPVFSADNTLVLNLPVGYRTIRVYAFGWEDAVATVLVDEKNPVAADFILNPAKFALKDTAANRQRINPKISGGLGYALYRFTVSAPGSGIFTVLDKNGSVVYQENLAPFVTWLQTITWNGRDSSGDILPEGVYTVKIEARATQEFSPNDTEPVAVSFETEINYSINIFPLSLSGGLSGLAFSPLPHVLPAGSFQIEGGIFAGNFQNEKIFSSLPFEAGMRVSPFNRLEISSVFNINPRFASKTESDGRTGLGVSGSAKFNILNGNPLAFSAGFSYTWANENGDTSLNSGRGIGIYLPLSLELKNVSIGLGPGVFWRGPSGPVPELLLSTGLLYRGARFFAGVSARAELDIFENQAENKTDPKILAGMEWRYIPPSFNPVFSCHFGMWTQSGQAGGYGRLGIGLIY